MGSAAVEFGGSYVPQYTDIV